MIAAALIAADRRITGMPALVIGIVLVVAAVAVVVAASVASVNDFRPPTPPRSDPTRPPTDT